MRILSIDSSLGTQLAVVDAAPSAAGARALQVLSQDEQADTRRHAESLGQMLSRALSAPEAAERPLDAVARFHLGNGARVERINWLGDPSPKGLKQSWGLMVNYYYDLRRLDKHRALLAQGKIAVSGAVESLRE